MKQTKRGQPGLGHIFKDKIKFRHPSHCLSQRVLFSRNSDLPVRTYMPTYPIRNLCAQSIHFLALSDPPTYSIHMQTSTPLHKYTLSHSENTHLQGKYHCTAGPPVWMDWIRQNKYLNMLLFNISKAADSK